MSQLLLGLLANDTTGTMSKRKLAVLIAVIACVVVSGTAIAQNVGDEAVPDTNETEPADAIYIDSDGSAILEYSEANANMKGSGAAGVNVDDGVIYGDYQQPVDMDMDATGSMSLDADREHVAGEGNLNVPQPDMVESLTLDAKAVTNADESKADLDFETTIAPQGQQAAFVTQMFDTFDAEGTVQTDGSTLTTEGSANLEATMTGTEEMHHEFDLSSTDNALVLEASQDYTVSEPEVGNYETEEAARQTLEEQYEEVGLTDLTIDSYSFNETVTGGGNLQIEYTAEMDLDEATSGTEMENVSIESAHLAIDYAEGSGSATWNAEIENYQALYLAYMNSLEDTSEAGFFGMADQMEDEFEAMKAANLAQNLSFQVSAETTADQKITAEGSMEQRSENWDAYISERQDRDLPPIGSQLFEMNVSAEGEEIVTDLQFNVEQEGMYDRVIENLESAYEESNMSESAEINPVALLDSAEFEKAQFDASLSENDVSAEGGISFGNLSAFTSLADEEIESGSFQWAHVIVEDGNTTAYVGLDNFADSDADPSSIKDTEMASSDTEVYAPGDWSTESQTYTTPHNGDVTWQQPSPGAGGGAGFAGPGFGPVVALIALVSMALIGYRRR